MRISDENDRVMRAQFRRAVEPGTKITLTGDALGKLMDAARKHERSKKRQPTKIERLTDIFFNGRRA